MSEGDPIPQGDLDAICARALAASSVLDEGDLGPSIQRVICLRARVVELLAGPGPILWDVDVYVHDEIVGRRVRMGLRVSTRRVGSFVVRLVRGPVVGDEEGSAPWFVLVDACSDGPSGPVVILTYASGDARAAQRAATQYAATATERDLASDLHPDAHFFGARRLPRGTA